MTSSESKIQRNKNKRNQNAIDSSVESESLARDEKGNPIQFSADPSEGGIESASVAAADARRKQDNELKRLLDRDARKSSKSKYGNAIEKQKNRALSQNRPTPDEVYTPTEYQYHTDRIMLAVVAGLVAVSLLGWGAYMMFRGEAPVEQTQFAAAPYSEEEIYSDMVVQGPSETEPEAVAASEPVSAMEENPEAVKDSQAEPVGDVNQVEEAQASDSLEELKSALGEDTAPVAASAAPSQMEAPAQPNFANAFPSQAEPTAANSKEQGIFAEDKIARMNLARDVKNFEPTGIYESTDISLEGRNSFRPVFFTQLTGLNGQTVSHNWYYDDVLAASVKIKVGSDSWRASSNKRVDLGTLGQWKVEVVDAQGQVLARQSFNVVE
ncbi:MAG: hypothetical protein CMD81_04190 [Gammaproteobacteria bacterium]|nr:hypothetical protein [Gammaproteobacteria bacterium]HBF09472.1 hypothetical protein [Gammaproteobacteria bacterium]|tara:strand:- start:2371 stop:3516 length:1146 start_codon:yes stop_codon:yes gene_type:complete